MKQGDMGADLVPLRWKMASAKTVCPGEVGLAHLRRHDDGSVQALHGPGLSHNIKPRAISRSRFIFRGTESS